MPRMGKLAVKIILIVLVVAVLSAGGFALYAYWLEQQVDTDALLQQALETPSRPRATAFLLKAFCS